MISVNINLDKVAKTMSQANLKQATRHVLDGMMADMNKYVPRRVGTLQDTVHVDANDSAIVWSQRYAKAQYYGGNGRVRFKNYTTAGTGPYWDKVAANNHMKDWEQEFKNAFGV